MFCCFACRFSLEYPETFSNRITIRIIFSEYHSNAKYYWLMLTIFSKCYLHIIFILTAVNLSKKSSEAWENNGRKGDIGIKDARCEGHERHESRWDTTAPRERSTWDARARRARGMWDTRARREEQGMSGARAHSAGDRWGTRAHKTRGLQDMIAWRPW